MKTYIIALSLIVLFLTPSLLKAQDVIMKNDSTTIESKVLKIDKNVIEYKKWSNPDGPVYTINISDVLSIAYQNGEVEHYEKSAADSKSSQMYRIGSSLVVDRHTLTKDEARKLLTKDQYNTYISAKSQMQVGNIFAVIFVGAVFWDCVCFARMINCNDPFQFSTWSDRLMLSAIITDISCPLWLILTGIGKGRLNWVVDDYNNSGSLSVAPTLIKSEMPQLQSNYSLGMTLKVSF